MKYVVECMRCKQPEQRGTESDADDDFADGRRLSAALRQRAADPAREHDDGELEKREEEHELVLVRSGDGRGGARNIQLIPPLMEMTWPVI